jgi:hypothetical protein
MIYIFVPFLFMIFFKIVQASCIIIETFNMSEDVPKNIDTIVKEAKPKLNFKNINNKIINNVNLEHILNDINYKDYIDEINNKINEKNIPELIKEKIKDWNDLSDNTKINIYNINFDELSDEDINTLSKYDINDISINKLKQITHNFNIGNGIDFNNYQETIKFNDKYIHNLNNLCPIQYNNNYNKLFNSKAPQINNYSGYTRDWVFDITRYDPVPKQPYPYSSNYDD